MVRPLWAVVGALVLLLGWLAMVGYQADWQPVPAVRSLADSAERCGLPGLAARGYLLGAQLARQELVRGPLDRRQGRGQALVAEIVSLRDRAARVLLRAGYGAAAESVALEAARADYDDLPARVLLLETRLRGTAGQVQSARRELMLLALHHETPAVLHALGRSLMGLENQQDAAWEFRRVLQLDPGHLPSHLALAELALARQDRAQALQWLDQADQATRSTVNKRDLLRLREQADPQFNPWPQLAGYWWQDHGLSLGLALLYVLFLLSPLWGGVLRRWRAP